MKLADLRKLSIRKNLKIRFQLANGMECVISEHGLARVPELRRAPDFNLEQELTGVTAFLVETVTTDKKQTTPKPRAVSREELAVMLTTTSHSSGPGETEED
jgi:hypothetical protein